MQNYVHTSKHRSQIPFLLFHICPLFSFSSFVLRTYLYTFLMSDIFHTSIMWAWENGERYSTYEKWNICTAASYSLRRYFVEYITWTARNMIKDPVCKKRTWLCNVLLVIPFIVITKFVTLYIYVYKEGNLLY